MKVLAVGDVCAPDGCAYAIKMIPAVKREENIDFVIVNAENSASGMGITTLIFNELKLYAKWR